jgi:SAM-dependent methyltransferase
VHKLPPSVHLFTLSMSYLVPRALHVVAELGVADHLFDEPRNAAALAAATGTGALPDRLGRLLRLLAVHGIFQLADEDRFRHNDVSRLLRSDHPQSMRDFVIMLGAASRWQAVGELRHTVLTGETGMRKAFGQERFEYNSRHPEEGVIFDRAMRAKSQGDIAATLAAYDFAASGVIVDVGGGSGHLLAAILETTGGRGVLFELPAVAERVRAGGAQVFEIAAGDFFADPLPPGDTYLLMQVLHDWADDEATSILAAIRRAARPGAKVLVIEMLMPDGIAPHPARELDVLMMSVTGGRERTQAEFSDLMASSGWRFERVIPMSGPTVILEGIAA